MSTDDKDAREAPRLTPFGVIDKYLYDEKCMTWPSFHAERILEKLKAEGYDIVKSAGSSA